MPRDQQDVNDVEPAAEGEDEPRDEQRLGGDEDDLDVDQILEDTGDFFTAEDETEPVRDADAPPPG